VIWPFLSRSSPAPRRRRSRPVNADIGKIEEGQQVTFIWRGGSVWVLRRSQTWWTTCQGRGVLADPKSAYSTQPDYCNNAHRSVKPEYL